MARNRNDELRSWSPAVIIVNADDFGRCPAETDAALRCYKQERITSATAMVFMSDSSRSAELAREAGIDIGLHLNLSQRFTGEVTSSVVRDCHDRIVRFLTSNAYSLVVYNPTLRREFRYVYEAQLEEFIRLYGRPPSHIDGHQHKHLCTNMVLDGIIAADEKVRRSFSFWPGEKSSLNRAYRRLLDRSLARRYRLTDFFFSLQQCLQGNRLTRVFELSKTATVELMTHPIDGKEYAYLLSDAYLATLNQLNAGTYESL
jgi:predicted glycoside hydrolase/deacetylase ChbG (UPF0249 family)